jgi:hypothetical protein
VINGDDAKQLAYMNMFNCQGGEFPIRYLGFQSALPDCMSKTGPLSRRKMRRNSQPGGGAPFQLQEELL